MTFTVRTNFYVDEINYLVSVFVWLMSHSECWRDLAHCILAVVCWIIHRITSFEFRHSSSARTLYNKPWRNLCNTLASWVDIQWIRMKVTVQVLICKRQLTLVVTVLGRLRYPMRTCFSVTLTSQDEAQTIVWLSLSDASKIIGNAVRGGSVDRRNFSWCLLE